MTLLNQLLVKPWDSPEAQTENAHFLPYSRQADKRAALKVFLGVVAVLFGLLVVAYAGRMGYEDWRPAPQIGLMWVNTLVLVLASVALELARYAARQGQAERVRQALLGAGVFTLLFLFGQAQAWRELASLVYFQVTNPAIAFFYLITGMHGAHLLGGLVAWGRTLARVWGNFESEKIRHGVELCALYWHFLLLVWLVLFALLFTGNNLDVLLTICGIR